MINNKQISRVVKMIADYYAPDQIWLFGSHAKGNEDASSDVDIIVVKNTQLHKRQRGHDLSDYLYNFPFKIDLIFVTKEELETQLKLNNSFLSSIMFNSKIIFEKKRN